MKSILLGSALLSLSLVTPAYATDLAKAVIGTWKSLPPVSATNDGVTMTVSNLTRTFNGSNSDGEYILNLKSKDIPAGIAKHKVRDSFAYSIEGNKLIMRVSTADVISASPTKESIQMATRLDHLLSRPNKVTLTIESLENGKMVLFETAAKVRYTYTKIK